jgi:hypothetical protein
MEEALRYNQHLQFCKQLQALQQQLCEETQLSSELLSSLYALEKYHQTPASCLTQLAAAFPEVGTAWQVLTYLGQPVQLDGGMVSSCGVPMLSADSTIAL